MALYLYISFVVYITITAGLLAVYWVTESRGDLAVERAGMTLVLLVWPFLLIYLIGCALFARADRAISGT